MNKIKFQEALQNFVDMFGWKGFIHVLFYPLIVLIATPIRLFKTLWNCRSLAEGKHWKDYPHFSVYSALNSLFYHTRAINLRRHGRAGKSPYLGLGGYKLNRCFHYSLCSLYAYEKAGAVTLILGMFGWWAGHFLWLDADAGRWQLVSMILLLSLCSTTFYVNTFELQNYNVFGWVFFPIGLYGWLTGNWVISSLAWLGASFGSFTVVVIAAILAFVYCLEIGSILPFISVLPAGMSLLSNMWPNFNARGALNTFRGILKAIGLSKANAKYVRTTMMNITIRKVYFLVIYFQFILVLTLIQKQIPVLLSASFIIWIINSKFARFSDEQTMQMLMLTVSTASVLKFNQFNVLILASYWVLASPIPLLLGFQDQKCLSAVPCFRPFNISTLIKKMNHFLLPVAEGQKILMAFEDPKGVYEAVFDGYRILLEAPLYVAAQKKVHLIPDWWGVFELNYEGAPDFWGRDLSTVLRNTRIWKADFVIIYEKAGSEIDPKWENAGFIVLDKFSWIDQESDLRGIKPYKGMAPDWWLLKVPEPLQSPDER